MIGSGKRVRVRREMEFRYEQWLWTVRVLVQGDWALYWQGPARKVSLHDAMTVAANVASGDRSVPQEWAAQLHQEWGG